MKAHTSDFKNQIKTMGRELDSKITYTLNGVNVELGKEQLNSITPTYQGALLKSVMKELDIDSNVYIPEKTILNYQFGVKVNGEYEYINFGNYVVYKVEKQEDTSSYKITCYDKLLYSMKQNEDLGVTYPISVRDYIDALCTKIGLEFKNKTDVFANYDKMITKELYVGQEYTYRDIFDELSQVTASTICLDIDDKVEIRYINKLTDLQIAEGTNITITDSEQDTINSLTLDGVCEQKTTSIANGDEYDSPSPDYPQEIKTIENSLKITSCNKNLLDDTKLAITSGSGNGSKKIDSEGKITSIDPIYDNRGYGYKYCDYFFTLGKGSYYLYYEIFTPTSNVNAYMNIYNENNRIYVSNFANKTGVISTKFTLEDFSNIGIEFKLYEGKIRLWILKDEAQDTSYEKHLETQIEANLPEGEFIGKINDTYKDTLKVEYNEEDGQYHLNLYKNVGKVVLDGSESWIKSTSYSNDNYLMFFINDNKYLSNKPCKSNNFINGTYAELQQSDMNCIGHAGKSLNIRISVNFLNGTTVNDFKNWLSTHNTEVYYVLATPYVLDLGIVDEMLNTYKGTTHIFNSVDTNMSVTYVNEYETIDEEFLNDVNVNVAKKYGPINSIVLSRSAESDNIYLQDEKSVQANGLCELKIVDNQIMNWNDRSDYLPDILEKLDGLEYYLNDFVSTGVAYLELCDNYKLKVFDNIYNCILLNDELDVTQGLVENIHTDMPMETETDYTKADKTDRRISNVSLIVDKQQKEINALANKIVDISNNASGIGTLNITNGSKGILHKLDIYGTLELPIVGCQLGTSASKVGYSKVGASLVKAFNKYIKPLIVGQFNVNSFKIIIKQGDNAKEYSIDDMNNLYQIGTTHDTFEYLDGKCSITRRIGLNNDGTKYILDTPYVEQLKDLNIEVPEGDYTISSNYELHLDVEYLTKNEYTDAFAKQVELQSEINVRSDEIEVLSKKKVNNDEVIASINLTPEKAQIDANKISLKGKEINLTSDDIEITSNNFKVDKQGKLECKNANVQGKIESKEGNVGGWLISDGSLNNGTNFVRSNGYSNIYTTSDIIILRAYLNGESWAKDIGEDTTLFNFYDVNHDGVVDILDLLIMKKMIMGVDTQIKEGLNNGKN